MCDWAAKYPGGFLKSWKLFKMKRLSKDVNDEIFHESNVTLPKGDLPPTEEGSLLLLIQVIMEWFVTGSTVICLLRDEF